MRASVLFFIAFFPTAALTAECPWELGTTFHGPKDAELSRLSATTEKIPVGILVREEYHIHVENIQSARVFETAPKWQNPHSILEIVFNTKALRFSYKDEKLKIITTYQTAIDKPGESQIFERTVAGVVMSPFLALAALPTLLPGGDNPVTLMQKMGVLNCQHVVTSEGIKRNPIAEISISELPSNHSIADQLTIYVGSSSARVKLGQFTPVWNKQEGAQHRVHIPIFRVKKDIVDAINSEDSTEIRVTHAPSYSSEGLSDAIKPAKLSLNTNSGEYFAKVDLSQVKKQALRDYREKQDQDMLEARENLSPWNP